MSDYAIYLQQVPSVIDVATGPAPFVAVNPPPVLLALGVSSVPLGSGAQAVPLIGTSFVATTVAAVDGVPVATVFVDSSHLTATLPAPLIATAGVKAVTAVSPGPGGGVSASLPLSVLNPAVTLTAIAPARATEGAPDTLFTLTGTGFVQGVTVVKAGATVLASTWVSATSMTATLTAAQLAAATTYGITATNPTPGGGVSASQTFTVVAQILWDTGDLSTLLSAGQVNVGLLASLGLLFARASVATLINTGATNVLDTSVPIDIPRVENRGTGVKGLLFEESRVNGQFFSSQLGSWGTSGTTPAAVGSLVTTDAATAPDGTTSADRVAPSATGGLLFTGSGPSFTSTGATVTNSIWLKHRAGSSGSIRGVCSFNGQGTFDSDGTIKTWKRYASTYTSSGATCNSALTIVSPNIPDVDAWGSQCEPGAYPTSYIVQANSVLATRAGERMYRLLAPLLDGGRLGLHVRFCPLGSSSEQTTNVRLFTTTGGDYAEVNKTTRVLTVSVAGVTVTLGALPTWARGDVFDIFIACGGGVLTTAASCRVNGGATVNLSFGAAQGTLTGTYLDVICNGTTQQFSSDFARGVAYSAGVKPSWATSAGSVVTTTTSSMTVTTGQRWQNPVAATIGGAGFTSQSQVCVDGVPIPPIQNLDGTTTPAYAYVNPTTMTVTLPDTAFWTTGTRAITVIDAFGAASNPQNVVVTYEAAIKSHSRNDAANITTSAGVAQVLDTTGNARPLAQITGSKQPAAVAGGLNGRTTWRCDAIDDRLKTPSFAIAQPYGIVVVRKAVTWASARIEVDGSDTANQNVIAEQGTTPQLQVYSFGGGGYTAANSKATVGAFKVVHAKFASAVASLQVNWGVATTGATGSAGLLGVSFGGSGTDTNFANVEGAELLTYDAATISSATLANYARELESVHGGAVAKRRNVVMVGDSLTEGTAVANPAQRYVALLAARPEFSNGSWTFTNKGVSGRTVADITAAYSTDVTPLYDPEATNILCVLAGTNGGSLSSQYAAKAAYYAQAKADGWRVVICTELSWNDSAAANDLDRTPDNANDRANYATNGYALCDFALDSRIGLLNSYLNTTYFIDGKHPDYGGNLVMVGIMAPILAKVGY